MEGNAWAAARAARTSLQVLGIGIGGLVLLGIANKHDLNSSLLVLVVLTGCNLQFAVVVCRRCQDSRFALRSMLHPSCLLTNVSFWFV